MAATSIYEQWMLEMLNAARLDPAAMAARFGISLNDGLPPGTISATPKQALAMSDILLATSDYHNDWMIANGSFSTTGDQGSNPGDRMAYAGFNDGETFDWGETLHWKPFNASASVNEDSVAYSIWREMFLDPQSRAILLNGDYNEIGIGFTNGIVGGTPTVRAFVVGHDLAASDERFITGGALSFTFDDVLSMPNPMSPRIVTGTDGSTTTGAAGGYRIAATSDLQVVTLGDLTVSLQMPDENVKLDLAGPSSVRSSHTITLEAGVRVAELLGIRDADLITANDNGAVSLYGNSGANHLLGNWANDRLDGGAGADRLEGGYGNDWYVVDHTDDLIVELAGRGSDTVVLTFNDSVATVNYALAAGASVETIRSEGIISNLKVTGNEFGQEIHGNFFATNNLSGGGGDDTIFGQHDQDTLHGGLGRDRLYGYGGGDRYVYLSAAESAVGATRDVLGSWQADLDAFGGQDLIDFSQFDANTLMGGWQGLTFDGFGAATRTVGAGHLKYYHTGGNTYLVASVDGDDQADFQVEVTGLHHFDKNSFIGLNSVSPGTPGNDTIVGTSGNETIHGGLGKDSLTGGGGADRFVFNSHSDSLVGVPRDVITDWSSDDKLDLSAFDARRDLAEHQNFTFLGAGTATRTVGAGELKYYHVNGKTYLVGSSDGDSDADLQIEFNGLHHFNASNFIGIGSPGVTGTTGADTLNGTSGSDAVRGGLGADTLYGGGGSDRFIYHAAAESGAGPARDIIKDWSADDRIDLALMDGNTATGGQDDLTFIGYGPATRTIDTGMVKYYQTGGNTYVVASVDGNDQADFQIEISGLHTLTASNFIL